MAKWVHFKKDHDHRWPTGAVTAFKAGMKVYVKDEVLDGRKIDGKFDVIDKPADDDPALVTTKTPVESKGPGNPVSPSAVAESVRIQAGDTDPKAVAAVVAATADGKTKG